MVSHIPALFEQRHSGLDTLYIDILCMSTIQTNKNKNFLSDPEMVYVVTNLFLIKVIFRAGHSIEDTMSLLELYKTTQVS